MSITRPDRLPVSVVTTPPLPGDRRRCLAARLHFRHRRDELGSAVAQDLRDQDPRGWSSKIASSTETIEVWNGFERGIGLGDHPRTEGVAGPDGKRRGEKCGPRTPAVR
jgi:hypothetical protein